MSDKRYTVLNAMVDIIASPNRALDEIRTHTAWLWWPLILIMALTSVVFAWYFSWVDFDWLVEETIRGLPAENRAEAGPGLRSFMSPTSSIAITIASVVFMSVVLHAILAAYYLLVSRITGNAEVSYGQWFSLSVWAAFPAIFNVAGMVAVILLADSNQLPQQELAALSFNQLFIHAEPGDPWFNWGNAANLIQVWSVFLVGLGIARWTASSLVKGLVVAALPMVAFFGTWAFLV